MSQFNYQNAIDPNSSGGNDLNGALDLYELAVNSNHSGASRPSYAVAGMIWVQTVSATNHKVNFFDGTSDITLAKINPSNNQVILYSHDILAANNIWLNSNSASALYGKTNAGLGKRLAYITSADVATFGDGGVKSNYRGLNGSLQINNTDGVLIEQTGSGSRSVKLKSLGAVEIEFDSDNNGAGDDFIVRNGGETVIHHNGVRTILTGIATSFPLRVIGFSSSYIEFKDANSNTYRGLGWNNTTNRFEIEDDSGTYNEVVHSGNIASNLPSTLSPSLDVNVGRNLDVTGASTFDGLVTEKANRKLVDFGTVTTSGFYLITNPFGNSKWLDCDVKAMILYDGKWIDTGWLYSSNGYGVKAQSRSDGILVVTGGFRLASRPEDGGGGADSNGNQLTSASCKVVVTYHGDTSNA